MAQSFSQAPSQLNDFTEEALLGARVILIDANSQKN